MLDSSLRRGHLAIDGLDTLPGPGDVSNASIDDVRYRYSTVCPRAGHRRTLRPVGVHSWFVKRARLPEASQWAAGRGQPGHLRHIGYQTGAGVADHTSPIGTNDDLGTCSASPDYLTSRPYLNGPG